MVPDVSRRRLRPTRGRPAIAARVSGRRRDAARGWTVLTPTSMSEKFARVQELSAAGRRDEVIGILVRLVESPRFAIFPTATRATPPCTRFGDALVSAVPRSRARLFEASLALVPLRHLRAPRGTKARRESRSTPRSSRPLDDLKAVPGRGTAAQTRGEIAY